MHCIFKFYHIDRGYFVQRRNVLHALSTQTTERTRSKRVITMNGMQIIVLQSGFAMIGYFL